jgi:hypothetical protein
MDDWLHSGMAEGLPAPSYANVKDRRLGVGSVRAELVKKRLATL